MINLKKKTLLGIILFFGASAQIANAQVSLKASVKSNNVSLSSRFEYSVSVVGSADFTKVDFQKTDAFDILPGPTGTSQSFSFVNGSLSQSKTLTYILIAKKEGTQTIPPATVKIDGKKYQTKPITINVQKSSRASNSSRRGSSRSRSNKKLPTDKESFIKPIVEKRNLYVGEGATVTYKLYSRVNILRYEEVKDIKPEGFWVERFDLGKNIQMKTEYIDGVVYRVATIRKMRVYPTRDGKLTVSPYNIVCEALESDVKRNRGFLFDDFQAMFGMGSRTVKFKIPCPSITFKVKKLPQPQPETFTGGVGKYKFKAKLDKSEAMVGEFVTINLNISGEGNVKTIGETVINLPNEFEKRDPIVKKKSSRNRNTIFGSISEDIVIEPKVSGEFNLGEVKFSYFDPGKKKYVTLSSPELNLNVKPNPNAQNIGSYVSKQNLQKLGSDIRFIKTSSPSLSKKPFSPLYKSPIFYAVLGFPFLAFLGFLVLYKRDEKLNKNSAYRRAYFASPQAKKSLRKAIKHLKHGEQNEFFASLEKAILKFLGDKYNTDVLAMTKNDVKQFMKIKKLPDELIEKSMVIIETSEFFRYAPTEKTPKDLENILKDAEHIISTLSKI